MSIVAVAAAATVLTGLLLAMPGVADPLPGGLGPCVPGDCPDEYPYPPHNGDFAGRDDAVNIFVGGDYRVRESAAEAEGRIVVGGDFDQDRASGGRYNIGVVGVGSRVPPSSGADWLVTGGNITVDAGEILDAVGADPGGGGVVRHAGTATGTIEAADNVTDADAFAPYADLAGQLEEASDCYADTSEVPATGTVTYPSSQAGPVATFTGNGTSARQVFYVDQDLVTASGGAVDLQFTGIPAGATVLVNVTTPDWTAKVTGSAPDTWTPLRDNMLWNIPDATDVEIGGTAQWQGSFLIGEPGGTTTVTAPGINGRFFTVGDLVHGGSGGGTGNEFHAYPFDGDLPACEVTPSPSDSTASPTESPSESPSASESPSPSDSPSPSESPSDSPSPSESPSSSGPSASPSTSSPGPTSPDTPTTTGPDRPGGLPITGGRFLTMVGIGVLLFAAGAAVLMMLQRRRQE
ncbi:hypothetical protein Pen01_50300 [Phytomonospora endophytica]|nr:hypothetical protein Pen01_50300 [Phytomonospora endophytica]